jgi:hypothetical protein
MAPNNPLSQLIWDFLGSAKDMGDENMISAARRLIRARQLGWTKHATGADKAVFAAWRNQ